MKDLDPGFPDQVLWFLIPASASLFDLFMDMTILIVSQPGPTASSMLDQQDLPIRFADRPNFLQRAHEIKERTGRERRREIVAISTADIEHAARSPEKKLSAFLRNSKQALS